MLVESFIEDSSHTGSIDELSHAYTKAIGRQGFTRSCYSVLSKNNSLCDEKCPGLVTNYSTEWIEHYKRSGYIDDDPVYRHAPSFLGMISWADIETRSLTKKQRQISAERRESGLRNGYSLFMRGPIGEVIGMSVANEGEEVKADKNSLALIYALMHQFNMRLVELSNVPQNVPPPQLSRRERDVLQWASSGNSNGSIADILGISEKTVEFHFSSVFKKLHVNNRILAVLKALNARII